MTDDLQSPNKSKGDGTFETLKSENFPLIDFWLDDEVVSLKTVNTNGSSWIARTEKHIVDLGSRDIKVDVDGISPIRILDVRVQPGGYQDAYNSLNNLAENKHVILNISEFSYEDIR